MMRSSVPTKRISWIFDIGDLRSGHFCDLPIISQWEKINSVIFTLAQAFLSGIISYRTVVDNSRKKLHYLPLQRSFEVTRGHQPSFANNFWSKRDRDVGLVSLRSSWPGESTDMQYDPFRSSRDLGLTWPVVKLWPWPFKVILYLVRRALARQTQCYQIRCSIFKIKDFIVQELFWKILEFWPLETPILTWAKNDRNDLEMIFRELSNAAFRFPLRRPGAEIMGGGVQTPPPPPQQAVGNPEAQQGAGYNATL